MLPNELIKKPIIATGIRFSFEINGVEIARGRLYVMNNDLRKEPFGFIEDVFVNEFHRRKGCGTKILETLIDEAKQRGCYKLIGTSRYSREKVHVLYEQNGFKKYGYEFRLDLIT